MKRIFSKVTVALAVLTLSVPAWAETVSYKADLSGKAESPPTTSAGQGSVAAVYDPANKTLVWTVNFTDLTGPVTAAHFHGPAAAGENAPPVIPIKSALTTPIKGSVTLTDQQAAELEAGKIYFNLHTAKFPNGEVRGQLMR
ncbi:MAG: CHRD domain-containing protein [Kaistia sp. SCN 65-12]|nr:MAG: CHRD domain-containing protein [Kaistia sp. SCN 65-12]